MNIIQAVDIPSRAVDRLFRKVCFTTTVTVIHNAKISAIVEIIEYSKDSEKDTVLPSVRTRYVVESSIANKPSMDNRS